jgi:7TM diverse intracellular signalling
MKIKNLKYVLLGILFIIVFSTCKKTEKESPKAEKGIIDLSNWDFEEDGIIDLNGEWEFYWEQLLTPTDFENNQSNNPEYVIVPGGWETGRNGYKKYPPFGYTTYRLLLLLPDSHSEYKFIINIFSSAKIWINDSLYYETGNVTANEDDYKAGAFKFQDYYNGTYNKGNDTLQLVIQAANHTLGAGFPGIYYKMEMGKPNQILEKDVRFILLNSIIIGLLFIIFCYHVVLYFYRRKEYSTLIIALLTIVFIVRALHTGTIIDRYVTDNFILSWKIAYILIPVYPFLMSIFFHRIYGKETSKIFVWIISVISIILFAIILVSNNYIATLLNTLLALNVLITAFYFAIFVLPKAIKLKRQGAIWAFIGLLILLYTNINDALNAVNLISRVYISNYGFAAFIFFQALSIAERFSISFKLNKKLNYRLDYQNKNLEKIVKKRTQEVEIQKVELKEQNNELIVRVCI